jgi:hypothetical protein
MTPKDKRDRLFKSGRPVIRPFQVYEGENYGSELGVLWVAYQKKPFEWLKKGLAQDLFAKSIEEISNKENLLVWEDDNKRFKSGRGMVAVCSLIDDGWKYEPHVQFMPWATKRNVLRTTVAFLQYIRYSKKVGVCVVHSLENSTNLFDKCCEYGVLHKVGKVVNGDPRGDEYLYSVSGKRRNNVTKAR